MRKHDDLKLLAAKGFIIPFETGVVVITHWKVHNYIRKDTYTETAYQDEKAALQLKDNKVYFLPSTDCIRTVDEPSTQYRLDKNRLDKNSIDICAEQLHSSTAGNRRSAFYFSCFEWQKQFSCLSETGKRMGRIIPGCECSARTPKHVRLA